MSELYHRSDTYFVYAVFFRAYVGGETSAGDRSIGGRNSYTRSMTIEDYCATGLLILYNEL